MNLGISMAFLIVVPIALLTVLIPTGEYTVQLLKHWKSQHGLNYAFLSYLCETGEDHIMHWPEMK